MNRSVFLGGIAGAAALAAMRLPAAADGAKPRVKVYRDTGCLCCEDWSAALTAAGYRVAIEDIDRTARLKRFAITEDMAGCHTASVSRYLVEGHVPPAALAQLLSERPKIRGIALPGMPSGVPGMPGPHATVTVLVLDPPHRPYYTG
jgi:hypothetical protein